MMHSTTILIGIFSVAVCTSQASAGEIPGAVSAQPRAKASAKPNRRFKRSLSSFKSLQGLGGASGFAPLSKGTFERISDDKSTPKIKKTKYKTASSEMDTGDDGEKVRQSTCIKGQVKGYECGRKPTYNLASVSPPGGYEGSSSASRRSSEMDSGNGRNLNGSNKPGKP